MNVYKQAMKDYDYINNRVVMCLVKIFCFVLSVLIVLSLFHV